MPSKCIRVPRSNDPEVLRDFMRRAFVVVVGGCAIQGDKGWPCRTCFFDTMKRLGIEGDEAHAFWLVHLRMRNDGSLVEGLYTVKTIPSQRALENEERIRKYQESLTKPKPKPVEPDYHD